MNSIYGFVSNQTQMKVVFFVFVLFHVMFCFFHSSKRLKVLATIHISIFHFFPYLLIFLQFRDPSYMYVPKNPVFLHYFSKFVGTFLFVLKYMCISVEISVFSEDDKWVFLTSKNHGQSL